MRVLKADRFGPYIGRKSGRQDGMRVPVTREVLYLTPQGQRPYFKGTLDTLVCDFAK